MMKAKIFIVTLVLLASVLFVDARRCYKCTSTNEGPCFEPGENSASTETCAPSSEEFSCSTTKVIQANNGDLVVKRDCLHTMLTDQFCAEFEDEGINGPNKYLMADCVVCDSDLCNSSSKIILFTFTSCMIWSLLLYKFL